MIDQLNKLSDEEVRVRVAERMGIDVAGYRWSIRYSNPGEDRGIYANGFHSKADAFKEAEKLKAEGFVVSSPLGRPIQTSDLPNFIGDLNAAFTLVEKLRGEGCGVVLVGPDDNNWHVHIHQGDHMYYAEDQSLARAICLSFLAVTEREEG